MYQFYLKIGKINVKINKLFISPETLTSHFDVALNKRNARSRVCILCMVVFMQRFDISGCQITVSETKCYVSTKIERPTYLSTLTSAQRITISIFL